VAYNDIGIIASSGANPDIGHELTGQSVGYNMIHHNYPLHINNLTSGVTIMAEVDWWRGEEPPSNRFYGVWINDPWLEGDAPEIHSQGGRVRSRRLMHVQMNFPRDTISRTTTRIPLTR